MYFEIGDRVRYCAGFLPCESGTIVAIDELDYGVQFDVEDKIFHDLGGRCPDNRGWWISCNDENLVPEEEPVIEMNISIDDLFCSRCEVTKNEIR